MPLLIIILFILGILAFLYSGSYINYHLDGFKHDPLVRMWVLGTFLIVMAIAIKVIWDIEMGF